VSEELRIIAEKIFPSDHPCDGCCINVITHDCLRLKYKFVDLGLPDCKNDYVYKLKEVSQ
jgi:hypothetical protein